MVTTAHSGEAARAWAAAASVPDPEVPCVTVADLGILRSVELDSDGIAVAKVTPTYSGCPATLAIEMAVEAALRDAGFDVRIERVLHPAWTTDWISDEGREKLRAYGIAPPVDGTAAPITLVGRISRLASPPPTVACPRCGSVHTERVSQHGSTPCKANWRCLDCLEPFDYFKCI